MTKIMMLGACVFGLFTAMSLTMTPPAVEAWDARRETHVIELDTIEIIGRVPQVVETIHSHEEYDVGDTHIVADGTAIIYASR